MTFTNTTYSGKTSAHSEKETRFSMRILLVSVVIIAGFVLPLTLADIWISLFVKAAVLGIFALSIGWLSNKTGLLSLGHSAFHGGSAYFVAVASSHLGWSLTASFFAAIIFTTVLGAVLGAAAIRIQGIGFAMVTLAFAQALYLLSTQPVARPLTGGDDGLSIGFGNFLWLSIQELNSRGLWPIVWFCLVAVCVLLWNINTSRFGTLLEAIRDNQERAKFSGFNTYRPRLMAFTISAFVASIGGALFALTVGFISPNELFWMASAYAVISAVIGGTKSLMGPLLGAAIYTLLTDSLATASTPDLYLGIVFVVVLVFTPAGLISVPRTMARKVRSMSGKSNQRGGEE